MRLHLHRQGKSLSQSHILLIFGGSLDFSLALAREAAKRHWAVARACADSQQETDWLDNLAAYGCERMFISSPLKNEAHHRHAIERVQRRWGHIDTVINVATLPCLGLFETSNDDDWQWLFSTSLLSVTHGCKAAISAMKRQQRGQLVNITSQTGRTPLPGQALTASMHGAIVSLTETLHAELAPLNVDVRLACVDYFDTLQSAAPRALTPLDQARFERLQNHTLSSDTIAASIIKWLTGSQFLLLPHKSGRDQWRRYRLRYTKWLQQLRQQAARLRPEQRFKR